MTDSSRTREHLEVLADALATPGEVTGRVLPLQRQNHEACPACHGTGYVRFRPAESLYRDDYCEQDCATCRPERQRAREAQR